MWWCARCGVLDVEVCWMWRCAGCGGVLDVEVCWMWRCAGCGGGLDVLARIRVNCVVL